jgi:hypothetical protein
MFFERGIQSSTRHHRLKHLVLFALRALLLLLVVLAFANPFVRRVAANTHDRVLVIVLDNSFSMRAGTRFADAKQAALGTLATKSPSQRGQVVVLSGRVQVLTQAIPDEAQLRAALQSVQLSDGHASFGELGRAMSAIAESIRTPIDVHLFSDMQRTAEPANFADMVMRGNVALHLHAVTPGTAPSNWTVESVEAPGELSDPKDPQRSRVRAIIAGYGTPAVTKTVSLIVNGQTKATKKVNVPANGRAPVEFAPLDVGYGFNRCDIRVEGGDALAADDASHFVVRRSDPERVLFVHAGGETRSAIYFGSALKAAAKSSYVLQSVSEEQTADFDPTRFAFVVLSDSVALPSIFEHSLAQYVAKGGGVLIALGTNAHRHAHIPVWGGEVTEAHDYAREGGSASVGQVDFAHPAVLDAKPGNDKGGWEEAKVYYVAGVGQGGARIAARLSDGTPLLLDKQIGQGHVVLLTSGLENLTNDLPLHPVFVALVDHSAQYLSGSERLNGPRLVDSFVQLRAADSKETTSVEVIDPYGQRPLSLGEARSAQTFRLEHAGFYQVRLANGRDTVMGVNADRRESDLQSMDEDVQKLWSGSTGGGAAQSESAPVQAERYRAVSIWWWVMLIALVASLAEMAFASGYMGTQREEI